MSGENDEIRAEGLHIDREVRDGLCGIDQHRGAELLGGCRHFTDRIDRAERVGNPGDGKDSGFFGKELLECGLIQHAVIIAGNHAQHCASALGEHLPWNDVRVVFQGGDEDFLAGGNG